jgi:hypothetical protein
MKSSEKDKKRSSDYYYNNRERLLRQCSAYNLEHKEERQKHYKSYRSSKHGKIMVAMQHMNQRCYNPKNSRYKTYGAKGIKVNISYEEMSLLWDRDNASSMKCPSIDRKDVNANYDITNCQFIERSLNTGKDKRKPVIQKTLSGEFVAEYASIAEASKKIGCRTAAICRVCKGERMQCYGFKWEYKQ